EVRRRRRALVASVPWTPNRRRRALRQPGLQFEALSLAARPAKRRRLEMALATHQRPRPALVAGYRQSVGVRADATVTAVGDNTYGQCDVADWRDIVAVAAGAAHTGNAHSVGLQADGTVVAAGWNKYGQCDVRTWRDIVSIAAGWRRTVGVKSDGTVVAVGRNDDGECEVSTWTDVVAAAAGDWHTVGLRADGTVMAVGNNRYGQCRVSGW